MSRGPIMARYRKKPIKVETEQWNGPADNDRFTDRTAMHPGPDIREAGEDVPGHGPAAPH